MAPAKRLSRLYYQSHPWGKDCLNLNADLLAEKLGGRNDESCIRIAQKQIRDTLHAALNERKNIIYETVFSHPSKLDIIRKARDLGYFIRLFFICTESPRINVDRVAERFAKGGHTVPGKKNRRTIQSRTHVWRRGHETRATWLSL
ncbi:MAG: zeta toxin family protein [Akkermansia sp.]|nr:zeta toxin family protein [Akkermansia sp.]